MPGRYKALLLAGGLGTRLRPLTNTVPKCLVPIGGKVLLDYWLDALEAAGVRDALLNTHHLRNAVVDHLKAANAKRTVKTQETYEPELLGSAGTVHANAQWVDDADGCLVIYADNLSNIDLTRVIEFHEGHGDPVTMVLFHTPYPKQCGIAEIDASGRVIDFVEKPERPKSNLANAGLYLVSTAAYREIAERDVFDLGFDVIPNFVGRMSGFVFDGYHRDIGNPEALENAREAAQRGFGAKA
ncbi:MAG: nucleotidyltransferase family protein [Myxococcales bacterium]|nr:nucleotidyltransferase family protein [Myxococcales bacterium]